jgi:hypothetical protein
LLDAEPSKIFDSVVNMVYHEVLFPHMTDGCQDQGVLI